MRLLLCVSSPPSSTLHCSKPELRLGLDSNPNHLGWGFFLPIFVFFLPRHLMRNLSYSWHSIEIHRRQRPCLFLCLFSASLVPPQGHQSPSGNQYRLPVFFAPLLRLYIYGLVLGWT